jgi:hypothetical protein
MSDPRDRQLSEDQARALWERAARMQAQAATRRLPASGDAGGEGLEEGSESGMSLEAVRRAAIEAGIDPVFVDDALVELDEAGPIGRVDEWADAYLGDTDDRTARVVRVIDASVEAVYRGLQRVAPRPPFGLDLRRIDGTNALEGGTLVFEVPYGLTNAGTMATSGPQIDIRHWADFRELRVRLHALDAAEGERPRTEVEVTASRAHARRANFWAGQSFGGIAGIAGGLVGSVIAVGLFGGVGAAEGLAILGGGGVSGLGGWFGVSRWWKSVYRYGQRKGEGGLARLLEAIEIDVKTDGAFSVPGQKGAAEGGSLDDLTGLSGLLG